MSKMGRLFWYGFIAVCVCTLAYRARAGVELIDNGDFETGDLTSWLLSDAGSGTISVESGDPPNGIGTAGPAGGSYYAVSWQNGPGTHAILQPFSVVSGSTVTLSFDAFAQSNSAGIVGNGLDHSLDPNQHARVDVLLANTSPFDTGMGVLGNFYLGTDGVGSNLPYKSYSYDISGLVGGGGSFQLRFAETDNQSNLSLGIDNVSIFAVLPDDPSNGPMGGGNAGGNQGGGTADPNVVPEPASMIIWSVIGLGMAFSFWRRRR